MFNIISVGSATLDVFLKSSCFPVTEKAKGRKIEVEERFLVSGGGGTNTATGFSRLGLKTACIARFGDDLFGDFVLKDLEKEGFDKRYLIQKKGDVTDYSTILVSPDASRVILVYRGKTRIDEISFPWQALDQTRWLYLASLEGNVELLEKVVEEAGKKGVMIALNPGSRELAKKEKLLSVFPKVKALILNMEEAEMFTKEKKEAVFEKVSKVGPEIVVVTQGKKGAHLFSEGKHLFSEAFTGGEIDETGAGDGFSSGFVSGLVKGFSLKDCLKLGMANGHHVVTKIGCKAGLLREVDIKDFLGRNLKIEEES